MKGRNGGTLKPFKKGEVSNPKGKPKGTKNRSTLIKQWLEAGENFKNPITGKNELLTQQDIMTLAMIKEARNGNVSAYKTLLEFAYPEENKSNEQTELTIEVNEIIVHNEPTDPPIQTD